MTFNPYYIIYINKEVMNMTNQINTNNKRILQLMKRIDFYDRNIAKGNLVEIDTFLKKQTQTEIVNLSKENELLKTGAKK